MSEPSATERRKRAAREHGVTVEQVERVEVELGLAPEPAAEHAADLARRNGRPSDAEAHVAARRAAALANLSGRLGLDGDAELLDLAHDGVHYIFELRDPRTGRPVAVRLTPAELLTLPNLRAAVFAATGRLTKAPKKGSQEWREIIETVEAAAERIEPDDDPGETWAARLDEYLTDRLGASKAEAVRNREPFLDDDGHVHVYAASFAAYLRNKRLDSEGTVEALRDLLRFERRDHGTGPRDRRSKRTYWRDPRPWQPDR